MTEVTAPDYIAYDDVLNCRIQNDGRTLREYLTDLLLTVWQEGECFSGKRPFGNSGWQSDVYHSLGKAEYVDGTWNNYDGFEEFEPDVNQADRLIAEVIRYMCAGEDR